MLTGEQERDTVCYMIPIFCFFGTKKRHILFSSHFNLCISTMCNMYTGSVFKHLHLLASRIIPIYISLIIHFSSVKFFL